MATNLHHLDFSGPRLKAERAEHHIRHLDEIFRHFIHANTRRLIRKDKTNTREARVTDLPRHTKTVLGDAVHNLRASLDHAYCELIRANGGTPLNQSYFPFHSTRQAAKGSVNGHKPRGATPSDKVIAAILDDIQPFEGGKGNLYGLHLLDRTDKHSGLIPAVRIMRAGTAIVRNEEGRVAQIWHDLNIISPDGYQGDFIGIADGWTAAMHNADKKPAFDICFAEGQPFEGESILQMIANLAKLVHAALATLEGEAKGATP